MARVAPGFNSSLEEPDWISMYLIPVMPWLARMALESLGMGVPLFRAMPTRTISNRLGSISMDCTRPTRTPRNDTLAPGFSPETESLNSTS